MTNVYVQYVDTLDGITWYTETISPEDTGIPNSGRESEYIVLIPSGEGDCYNLRRVAQLLASNGGYRILTFDMPGFSRTTAPNEAYTGVTPQLLSKQIVSLLDKLGIQEATFFGCSGGGAATLALCALFPDRVKCGIVHEVPLNASEMLLNMLSLTDDEIVAACKVNFGRVRIEQDINDGAHKWEELGEEYHDRLARNYVYFIRNYAETLWVGAWEVACVPENLRRRPLFWTVGSLNPGAEERKGYWKRNFEAAQAAGLEIERERLRCLHFPSVTIPEDLTEWILECVAKAKDQH